MFNIEHREICVCAQHFGLGESQWKIPMTYRGIDYSIAVTTTPGVWTWQFRIGDQLKSGKTETRIGLLAIRRVQLRIDRALKLAARIPAE
jgi:hypothetical protein